MGGGRAPRRVDATGQAVPPAPLRVLHVVLQAGPTNSQWNEHCLPVADERQVTVCSLFPATVQPDPRIIRFEGDGTVRGCLTALRRALRDRDYDVVHVHAPASAAVLLAACALERRSIDDVVFTLHTSWPNLRRRNRLLAAGAFLAFPSVVACGQSSADSVPAYLRRLSRRVADVVPNGVDLDRIDRALARGTDPALDRNRSSDGVTVATAGRLTPVKEQATLLAAFAQVARPHDRLLLIGDGPLRPELERKGAELGLPGRLELPGLLPREEVYRLLAEADVFVSTSRIEGLPVSVLEAMAVGLPVILSDIPPHREIVEAAGVARLVPVGDVEALAGALDGVFRMDGAERVALGVRSRQVVENRFSLRSMAQGYHRVYTRLCESGRMLTKEVP